MMKYFWTIFIFFEFIYLVTYSLSLELYNRSSANIRCNENGGLLNFTKIIQNGYLKLDSFDTELISISEGESAWISGYVIYSRFIKWLGCYQENTGIYDQVAKVSKSRIFHCVKTCLLFTFFGISKQFCYCFNNETLNKKLIPIGDGNCSIQRPYNIYFNKTGSIGNVLHVYRSFKNLPIDTNYRFRQCILASNASNATAGESFNTTIYKTSSCYASDNLVTGFLDNNSFTENLNNISLESNTTAHTVGKQSGDICDMCQVVPGKLLDNWVGVYRSFEVGNDKNDTCLAVTMKAGKLIIDPDDCLVKKNYICNTYIKPTAKTTTTTNIETTTYSSESKKRSIIQIVIITTLPLSLFILITLLITFLVRKVRKRRKATKIRVNPSVSNDERGTMTHPSVEYHDYDYMTVHNSEPKITEAEKQNLRKQSQCSTYQIAILKSDQSSTCSDRPAGKMNEEYDRLDLKCKSIRSKCCHGNNENHVYDHTSPAESYDIFRPKQFIGQTDSVTYSKVQQNCKTGDGNDENYSEIDL